MRGQVSLEFMIIVGIAAISLVSMLWVGAVKLNEAAENRRLHLTNDILATIQYELLTADTVHDGYSRTFNLPFKLENKPYTLIVVNDSIASVVTLNSSTIRQSVPVPRCTGVLRPGVNVIERENGSLLCNPS